MDLSIQYDSSGLKIDIFSSRESMPCVNGVGDVLLVRNITASTFHKSAFSLSHNL